MHGVSGQNSGRDDACGQCCGCGQADQAHSAANTSSEFMMFDPNVTLCSGSAIVSAGAIAVANSSAQQGRYAVNAFATD
jgi:hypothetical protein